MKTMFLHGSTIRENGDKDTFWTKEVEAKYSPLNSGTCFIGKLQAVGENITVQD